MDRYAAILVRDLALQGLLRHTPELRDKPVALVMGEKAKARILQVTSAAASAGVVPGMSPTQGQARCSGLLLRNACPETLAATKAAMLQSAWAFSPWLEDTAEGVCTLRWPENARAHPCKIVEQFEGLHLRTSVGVAPNPDLALLAAQGAELTKKPGGVLEIDDARQLAALPLGLVLPPHLHQLLERWGVRTLGSFVALGRANLLQRIGPDILPYFERASGNVQRPLRCMEPSESFEEFTELEHGIETLEPLLFVLRRFVDQLCLRVEAVWMVVAELHLTLGLDNGSFHERMFRVPSPTCNAGVLFGMLHTHLEGFRAPWPIVSARLAAIPGRAHRQQFSFFESALRDPNRFFETMARLHALLGPGRVGTPQLENSRRPDAFAMEGSLQKSTVSMPSMPSTGAMGGMASPMPLRRLRPPLPARVEASGEKPVYLACEQACGPIAAAHGPLHLSGDWWTDKPWQRQEWDVQLQDGCLCRIFHEKGQWFLEGFYD